MLGGWHWSVNNWNHRDPPIGTHLYRDDPGKYSSSTLKQIRNGFFPHDIFPIWMGKTCPMKTGHNVNFCAMARANQKQPTRNTWHFSCTVQGRAITFCTSEAQHHGAQGRPEVVLTLLGHKTAPLDRFSGPLEMFSGHFWSLPAASAYCRKRPRRCSKSTSGVCRKPRVLYKHLRGAFWNL